MKLRPGDIALNLNPRVGVKSYSKDTYTTQVVKDAFAILPPSDLSVEEQVLEMKQEIVKEEPKPKKDELRRSQVE